MHVCPMVTGIVPHVGGPILPPCEPTVLIGMLPAARITDMLTCVGPPDMIAMGSPTVLIGGLMAARIGDPTVHGGVIVLGCFTVIIGEAGTPAPSAPSAPSVLSAPTLASPAAPAAAAAPPPAAAPPAAVAVTSLIKSTPKLNDLPAEIAISKEACKSMEKLSKKSIDSSGNSVEHCGTFATGPDGGLVVLNEKSGASGDCTPSTKVPSGYKYAGTFHTHPYGKNDGTWDGAQLPFSDGDFSTLDSYHEQVSAVQSGDKKYVLVRTDKSPTSINSAKAKKEYDKIFDKEYAAAQKAGKTDAQAAGIAGEAATADLAKKYNYGYYSGTDCGHLSRTNP